MRPTALALLAALSCAPRPAQGPQPAARPAAPERARSDGLVTLHLGVRGDGAVSVVDLAGWCDDDCAYPVAPGSRILLRAESGADFFAGWDGPCGNQPECVLAPTEDVHVTARFDADRYHFAWATALSSTDCIGAESLTVDRDLVMTGLLRGTADLAGRAVTSAGSNDVLVTGLDRASGAVRWARTHGGPALDTHDLIGVRAQGELVLQTTTFDEKVPRRSQIRARISPLDGAMLQSAPAAALLHDARLLPDDGVIGVANLPLRGPTKVVREDRHGRRVWETPFEASGRLRIRHLAIDGADVLVVGSVDGDPRFGTRWSGARQRAVSSDFVARMRATDGTLVETRWMSSRKRLEGVEAFAVRGGELVFALLAESTIFLDQTLTSPDEGRQLWLVGTGRDLRVRWTQRFRPLGFVGDVHLDWSAGSLLVTGVVNGRIVAGSRTVGRSSHRSTAFVVELAPDGRVLWAGGAQPGDDHRPPVLARDAAGALYLSGSLDHEAAFGPHTIAPSASAGSAPTPSRGRAVCRSLYVTKLVRAR